MVRHILDDSEYRNYVGLQKASAHIKEKDLRLVKAIRAYNEDHPPECEQCKGVGYVCSGCPWQIFDECPLGNEMVFPK